MFDFDKWQEIFDTLRRNPLRTLLTAFGVFWGVFMLIVLQGAGDGLYNSVAADFEDDALTAMFVWGGTTTKPYKGHKPGRRIFFDNSDLDALSPEKLRIVQTEPIYTPSNLGNTVYKDKTANLNLRASGPGFHELEYHQLTRGRLLNQRDVDEKRKVCVLGRIAVEMLFDEEEDPVNKYVKLGGVMFRIVGTYDDPGGQWDNRRIVMPYTTAQQVYNSGKSDLTHLFILGPDDLNTASFERLDKQIRQTLGERHNFDPEDRQAMGIGNGVRQYVMVNNIFFGIRTFIWFVGVMTILAGAIGVSNIMLIVVKERTQEIGIRKALGATPASIVTMFLSEAVFLTGVAGYFGLVAGVALINTLNWYMRTNNIELDEFKDPGVDFASAIAAVAVLTVIGGLAGLIPALKAARIHPVEAMRA